MAAQVLTSYTEETENGFQLFQCIKSAYCYELYADTNTPYLPSHVSYVQSRCSLGDERDKII